MGILLVLAVLVLGYYYTDQYIPAKVLLKRSSGWESYVYLGKYGIYFLMKGSYITLFIFILFYLTSFLLNIPVYCFGADYSTFHLERYLAYELFNLPDLSIQLYWVLIFIFSFALCKDEIKKKNLDIDQIYKELGETDSILNIILESSRSQVPVKIALKSKKVYVGLVDSEQFESADLDNIVIIPLLSGYRHKDELRIIFDCNYNEVYLKNGITATSIPNLRYFRTIIRVNEIESISLFNSEYYDDFKQDSSLVKEESS